VILSGHNSLPRRRALAAAALVAYLPALLSSPGQVGANTKSYLYLDPGRLLQRAPQLWDSDYALGTLTHQNIGYLWPMGPFYWTFDALGLPDWVAQRLWLGSLLFAAGAGVWFLLRTLGWRGHGVVVAMLAYELSPYLLNYSARISALLLPWAALPWMIALTIRAARCGGWRHPALFALLVLTVGSVNATALVMAGLAPLLWLAHAALAERSISARRALAVAGRIGVLCALTSLWWAAALAVQGRYGLNNLYYTETYETVADASTAPEILRGLGYWFFYGNDKLGQWIEPSIEYTQGVWLLFLSYGLVVLALLGAFLVRWQHRSFFLLLLAVGALVGVGSHPYGDPSALGALFKDFTSTDFGLALRSTPRAVPLLVLATAVLLGALIRALRLRWPRAAAGFALLTLCAIVLANPAIWRVRMIEEHLQRPESLPEYWLEAIESLEAGDDGSRVWELPGSNFASYRWGNTIDPITPGLMERGYVARELIPFGSAESADLLTGIDRFMQENSADPDSLAPIARLMSVGDIVHRADLTFERFRTPRPGLFDSFLSAAPGLRRAETFGDGVPNIAGPEQTLLDEVHLAAAIHHRDPAALVRYVVDDPLPVVRMRDLSSSTVVVGDGEGLVHAAAAGVLDVGRALFFGADLAVDDDLRERVLEDGARIVVTDTNKRRGRRWGVMRENVGATETAGETPLRADSSDNRLPLFPDAVEALGPDADDIFSVAVQEGPYAVSATAYGNPVTYIPADRPVKAVDGDIDTRWAVAAFSEARGHRIQLRYAEPATVDEITFLQPQVALNPAAVPNRWITEIAIRADGERLATVELTEESRLPPGQSVTFDPLTVEVLEVEITDLDHPLTSRYEGVWPVGFAEITPSVSGIVTEAVRTPRAFLDVLGPDLTDHDLAVVLTRERSNPHEAVRRTPEIAIRRIVPLGADRSFRVTGTARLRSDVSTTVTDEALGRGRHGSPVVTASEFLPGDLKSHPASAFDGRPDTFWTTPFEDKRGAWLQIDLPDDRPAEARELGVWIVADELHSVPSALRVTVDGEDRGVFDTGLGLVDAPYGSLRRVDLPVDLRNARTIHIEAAEVTDRLTRDFYSNSLVAMPIAIAEVDLGVPKLPAPSAIDSGCISGLLTIDGRDVAVRLRAAASEALAGGEIELSACGPVTAGAGDVAVIVAADRLDGSPWAYEVDRLVLTSPGDAAAASAAGTSDKPAAAAGTGSEGRSAVASTPEAAEDSGTPRGSTGLAFERTGESSYRVVIEAAAHDRLLVLGQSRNDGWRAELDGSELEGPILVDGFANGWWVPAGAEGTAEIVWTPQRAVDVALAVSAVAVLFTIVLAWRAKRSWPQAEAHSEPPPRADGPLLPALISLDGRAYDSARLSRPVAALAAALSTLFAVLNLPSHHWAALLLGGLGYITLRSRRLGRSAALGAGLLYGITALLVMIAQRRFLYPPDFGWPEQFDSYHILGVLTILLVAVDYMRSVLRPGRR